jgi:hypothetical protein
MIFTKLINKILGRKAETTDHPLDFTERTAAVKTEPVLGKPMNDHVEATAPAAEPKAKKPRAKKPKTNE